MNVDNKDDFFYDLAIITDLLEKLKLTIKKTTISFDLNEQSFNFVLRECQRKIKNYELSSTDNFEIKIGDVIIEFNKSKF